jgi:hypothetical protein
MAQGPGPAEGRAQVTLTRSPCSSDLSYVGSHGSYDTSDAREGGTRHRQRYLHRRTLFGSGGLYHANTLRLRAALYEAVRVEVELENQDLANFVARLRRSR